MLLISIAVFPPLARKMLAGQENTKKILVIKDKKVFVEIADTAEKRAAGLMFREKLEKNSGMLFIFKKPVKTSFWMYNTTLPLSIAFIDEKGIILQIEDMKPKDLTPVFTRYKVLYALEVNKGWFETNKIRIGDIVKGITE
ncbi:MAG: DUF192 domain-containing protein [Candidatus Firestonebacteria bacterium]